MWYLRFIVHRDNDQAGRIQTDRINNMRGIIKRRSSEQLKKEEAANGSETELKQDAVDICPW